MTFGEIRWLADRTLTLDWKYFLRSGDSIGNKIDFVFKKYWVLFYHFFHRFHLGKNFVTVDDKRLYYNSPIGFAGYQAVLSEHNFWLRQLDDIAEKPIIIDIGANVGYFALGAKKVFPAAEIHCFEPVDQTFVCLKKNLAGFRKVYFHKQAIGNRNGTTFIKTDSEQPSLSTLDKKGGQRTEIIRLDSFYKKHLDGKQVDILKVDVEGLELDVLRGGVRLISQTKYLHMEFNSSNYSLSDLIEVLHRSKRRFQLLFIRNFSNDTDSKLESGDILLKIL